MSIWQKMKGWFTEESKRYVLQQIPKDRVDRGYDDAPVAADRAYLRIWLVEMMLSRSTEWFKTYQPAVHALVKLKFADQLVELARVAAPAKDKFAGDQAVLQNYPLLDLVPFRGGTVELDAALVAIEGDDRLGKAITAISGFAGLLSAPLSGALAVATKVKEGADLLFDEDGRVQLAYHNTLGGEGGANALVPGYVAVVLADATKLAGASLSVVGDRLHAGGAPLTGYDHMLLRVEAVPRRDDLHHFTDIEQLRDRAIAAFVRGSNDEGENAFRAALAQVATHPELINADRRALVQALREDVAAYRDAAHGATPLPDSAPPAWAIRVRELGGAADPSPITASELEAWMAP